MIRVSTIKFEASHGRKPHAMDATTIQFAVQAHPLRGNLREAFCAGHAVVTVRNVRTGNRFTYRVQSCEDKPDLFFVGVLTGSENTHDFSYLGTIRAQQYAHGRKSRIDTQAQSAQVFSWLWCHIDALPTCIEVWHEGRCLRCHRTLTVPESLESGFGPECSKKLGKVA